MFDFVHNPPPSPIDPHYDIADHYWLVGDRRDRAFSSKRGVYVPIEDTDFQAWLTRGDKRATTIKNVAQLWGVFWRANTDRPGIAERCAEGLGYPPCRRRCKAREFIGAFSPEDMLAIQAAVNQNGGLAKLWNQLLCQGEQPVDTKAATVQSGIQALVAVLGARRVQEIVNSLGLIVREAPDGAT